MIFHSTFHFSFYVSCISTYFKCSSVITRIGVPYSAVAPHIQHLLLSQIKVKNQSLWYSHIFGSFLIALTQAFHHFKCRHNLWVIEGNKSWMESDLPIDEVKCHSIEQHPPFNLALGQLFHRVTPQKDTSSSSYFLQPNRV